MRINVDVDGRSTNDDDRFGRREERMRDRDDFVARANTRGAQGKMQRIGAVGHTDAVSGPTVLGELTLECRGMWAKKEVHRVENLFDRPHHLVPHRLELGRQDN